MWTIGHLWSAHAPRGARAPEAAWAAADNLIAHADPSVVQQCQAVMAGTPADDSAQLGRDQRRLEPASPVIMVPVKPCALALEAKST
jgi:hypothetical protein